jgi:hypothetical protein
MKRPLRLARVYGFLLEGKASITPARAADMHASPGAEDGRRRVARAPWTQQGLQAEPKSPIAGTGSTKSSMTATG